MSDFSLITNKNVDLDPMKCYVYITYSLLTGCDLEYKIIFPVASPQMCIYPLSITSQTVVNRNILVFQQSSRLFIRVYSVWCKCIPFGMVLLVLRRIEYRILFFSSVSFCFGGRVGAH